MSKKNGQKMPAPIDPAKIAENCRQDLQAAVALFHLLLDDAELHKRFIQVVLEAAEKERQRVVDGILLDEKGKSTDEAVMP